MKIFEEIFKLPELQDDPPILIDVGASGKVHEIWKDFAKYSICIAFDADDREMSSVITSTSDFKKLIIINRLVDENSGESKPFYLTKSPYCSSLLEPNASNLDKWFNAPLFEIVKILELPTFSIEDGLKESGLSRIDWFKCDSQGIDLRILKSIESRLDRILAIDLEPGIRGAYKMEEKLYEIMAYMDKNNFWISDLVIKGSPKIQQSLLKDNFSNFEINRFSDLLRTSPGWGEISYLNNLSEYSVFTKRDYLLEWVFATVKNQHGFAMEIAVKGQNLFADPIFSQMKNESLSKIRMGIKTGFQKMKSRIKSTIKTLKNTIRN